MKVKTDILFGVRITYLAVALFTTQHFIDYWSYNILSLKNGEVWVKLMDLK